MAAADHTSTVNISNMILPNNAKEPLDLVHANIINGQWYQQPSASIASDWTSMMVLQQTAPGMYLELNNLVNPSKADMYSTDTGTAASLRYAGRRTGNIYDITFSCPAAGNNVVAVLQAIDFDPLVFNLAGPLNGKLVLPAGGQAADHFHVSVNLVINS